MSSRAQIEIRFEGYKGNEPLSPLNFDIKKLAELLHNIEPLINPYSQKERPLVSYSLEEGSVRHIFNTTLQAKASFLAILSLVANAAGNLDVLESNVATVLEEFQNMAVKKDYTIHFGAYKEEPTLVVTPKTKYYRSSPVWVESEVYLYGTIEDAGGKDKVNIHMSTDSGTVVIAVSKDELRKEEKNLLYRRYGVRASCRQNLLTGEVDKNSYRLLSMQRFDPKFDKAEFDRLVQKSSSSFAGIDADAYVRELRGAYKRTRLM